MKIKGLLIGIGTVLFLGAGFGRANASILVTDIPNTAPPGQWHDGDTQNDGTVGIVDISAAGGNLQNNQPLPNGATRITTTDNNTDRAEGTFNGNFGTVSNILNNGFRVGYSWYKEPVVHAGANTFAAPSLKLTFYNAAYFGDGYVTLIYEPYWNVAGLEGTAQVPTTGDWVTVDLGIDGGLFWQNGGFGQTNSAGGPPLKTLSGWDSAFDSGFDDASLVGISVGVGTYNKWQDGYFDNVSIEINRQLIVWDFEIAKVPEPASLALFGLGLAGLGVMRRRRQRSSIA